MDEYPLRGGSVNTVVRAGDTVRRRPGGRFVHELLGFFERSGWGGAPRFLGLDEQGREILSFVEGYVPWQEPGMPGVTAETSLVRVAELAREFHDLTAGTPLAGDAQVVCHNDLAIPRAGPGCPGRADRARDPADLRRVPARRTERDRGCDHVVAGPVLARHSGRRCGR
jgi:hypothetical protein